MAAIKAAHAFSNDDEALKALDTRLVEGDISLEEYQEIAGMLYEDEGFELNEEKKSESSGANLESSIPSNPNRRPLAISLVALACLGAVAAFIWIYAGPDERSQAESGNLILSNPHIGEVEASYEPNLYPDTFPIMRRSKRRRSKTVENPMPDRVLHIWNDGQNEMYGVNTPVDIVGFSRLPRHGKAMVTEGKLHYIPDTNYFSDSMVGNVSRRTVPRSVLSDSLHYVVKDRTGQFFIGSVVYHMNRITYEGNKSYEDVFLKNGEYKSYEIKPCDVGETIYLKALHESGSDISVVLIKQDQMQRFVEKRRYSTLEGWNETLSNGQQIERLDFLIQGDTYYMIFFVNDNSDARLKVMFSSKQEVSTVEGMTDSTWC